MGLQSQGKTLNKKFKIKHCFRIFRKPLEIFRDKILPIRFADNLDKFNVKEGDLTIFPRNSKSFLSKILSQYRCFLSDWVQRIKQGTICTRELFEYLMRFILFFFRSSFRPSGTVVFHIFILSPLKWQTGCKHWFLENLPVPKPTLYHFLLRVLMRRMPHH